MSTPANQSTIPVNTPVIAFQLSTANCLIFSQPIIAVIPAAMPTNTAAMPVNGASIIAPMPNAKPISTVSKLGNILLNAELKKSPNIPPISIPLPSSLANRF